MAGTGRYRRSNLVQHTALRLSAFGEHFDELRRELGLGEDADRFGMPDPIADFRKPSRSRRTLGAERDRAETMKPYRFSRYWVTSWKTMKGRSERPLNVTFNSASSAASLASSFSALARYCAACSGSISPNCCARVARDDDRVHGIKPEMHIHGAVVVLVLIGPFAVGARVLQSDRRLVRTGRRVRPGVLSSVITRAFSGIVAIALSRKTSRFSETRMIASAPLIASASEGFNAYE